MTIEERLELFKEFTKDGEKTNSILGDSSLGKYVSNLTGYEISVATKLLSQANSIFELTDPDAVIRVLKFFRSQKEFFANNTTLTAHYRDWSLFATIEALKCQMWRMLLKRTIFP